MMAARRRRTRARTSRRAFSSAANSRIAVEGGRIPVLNPHDNSLLAEVAEATAADVDRAVAAARKAFPAWKRMAAADRGRLLLKLADAIEADAAYLAELESLDTGHPIRDTRMLDVPRTAATFRYFGGMADKVQGSIIPVEAGFLNYVTREPLGVVGADRAVEFSVDVHQLEDGSGARGREYGGAQAGRIDSADDTAHRPVDGRTSAFRRASSTSCRATARPPGSTSPNTGESIRSASPARPPSGRKIVAGSAGNLKRVQLELGGKGANIVFDDASSRLPSMDPPSPSSTIRARPASPARGFCCTRRSPTNFWIASSR